MGRGKIRTALVKFIGKEANSDELENLEVWLKDKKNTSKFDLYVKIHFLITFCMIDYDIDKAKKNIQRRIDRNRKEKGLVFFKRLSIAASIAVLIGFVYFHSTKTDSKAASPETIVGGSNSAVLTLGNGEQVTLEKGKEYQTAVASSNGEEIIYKKEERTQNLRPVKYHFLTIPRGDEFSMELPDGTKVRLNSESQLKYPTSFPEDKPRGVELVYGEAY